MQCHNKHGVPFISEIELSENAPLTHRLLHDIPIVVSKICHTLFVAVSISFEYCCKYLEMCALGMLVRLTINPWEDEAKLLRDAPNVL